MIDEAGEYKGVLSSHVEYHLDKILEAFRSIEDTIELIEDNETEPWIRDLYYTNLKAIFTPVVRNSTEILRCCTIESIQENYEILVRYYRDICSMTESAIERLLDESLKNQKRIFSTFRDDENEYLVGSSSDENQLNFKDGLYCVYFTKDCSLEEVEWYLEHKLRKELKPNAKIKKHRINTKSLKVKSFIGVLTIYEEKPAKILRFCNKYLDEDEAITYVDVKRIKNRLSKEDWFKIAYEEKAMIENDALYKAIKNGVKLSKNPIEARKQALKSSRYLKLCFEINNGKPLFHVDRVK